MSHYIDLDSVRFESMLKNKGFTRLVQGSEVVYVFQHKHNKNVWIKCYTSISAGATVARECGGDAIRIVAVYNNGPYGNNGDKNFPLFKASRTYRVTSQEAVEEKVLTKLREAYEVATNWLKRHPDKPWL